MLCIVHFADIMPAIADLLSSDSRSSCFLSEIFVIPSLNYSEVDYSIWVDFLSLAFIENPSRNRLYMRCEFHERRKLYYGVIYNTFRIKTGFLIFLKFPPQLSNLSLCQTTKFAHPQVAAYLVAHFYPLVDDNWVFLGPGDVISTP